MEVKNLIYKDQFCQSLKPRNKVGDLVYQKELENPQVVISRNMGAELEKIELKRTDSIDSEEQ
jgi:hypothetical protein